MEFDLYTLVLVYSWMASFIHSSQPLTDREYDDIIVTELGKPTTLPCVDPEMTGAVTVNWIKSATPKGKKKVLFSANAGKVLSGHPKFLLADTNFLESGVFSLVFVPEMGDQGLISCLVEKQKKKLRQRVILLALLTVTILPASPVPYGILRLVASVYPYYIVGSITWAGPGGTPLRSEVKQKMETVTKIPHFNKNDEGTYVCVLHPKCNRSRATFSFNVDVKLDVKRENKEGIWGQQGRGEVLPHGCDASVASFTNVTHGLQISTGSVAHVPFPLFCPPIPGDYVLVHWKNLDKRIARKLVYQYDRWRNSTKTEGSPLLQLAYNAHDGFFSFLLIPEFKDAGLYICEVFLDDKCYSQKTTLSVLKVGVSPSSTSSSLHLSCEYSVISQVQQVGWSHQNMSCRPYSFSPGPGKINVNISLPITADTAGNYTCMMRLTNGQKIWAVYTVTLPTTVESTGVAAPSLLPPLSALLLLVPLVAAAVGVLLWRQRHIFQGGIEQSLSHHSWEAENIYENPEDMRLTSPQGSVYMDLKPGEGDDIYKELDRSEPSQC